MPYCKLPKGDYCTDILTVCKTCQFAGNGYQKIVKAFEETEYNSNYYRKYCRLYMQ